jgi:predicted ABC-type ATPase
VPAILHADELARGLSPLDPSAAAIKAGRLLPADQLYRLSICYLTIIDKSLIDSQ